MDKVASGFRIGLGVEANILGSHSIHFGLDYDLMKAESADFKDYDLLKASIGFFL